jgi:hypothetical protein
MDKRIAFLPFLTNMRAAFIIFSILSIAGVFASLARGNARSNHELRCSRGLDFQRR